MPQSLSDRVIALAGLFLATRLVNDLARTGTVNSQQLQTCIGSTLMLDADSSLAVYGDLRQLAPGLEQVVAQLGGPSQIECTRYVIGVMILERKLSRNAELEKQLGEELTAIAKKLDFFAGDYQTVIAALADLYSRTISTMNPRIMVQGDPHFLQDNETANKIRALLLAAIRAARLWQQSGGRRFTLVFRRRQLLLEAQRLLAEAEACH